MRAGAGGLRQEGEIIGAELAVVESLRQNVGADYAIDPIHAPGLFAGEYFDAVDGIGSSPAFAAQNIGALSEFARSGADRVLFEVAPPEVLTDGSVSNGCERGAFVAFDSVRTIDPGSTAFLLTSSSGSSVSIGRWAPPSYPVEVPSQNSVTIEFPDDALGASWTLQPDSADMLICVVV